MIILLIFFTIYIDINKLKIICYKIVKSCQIKNKQNILYNFQPIRFEKDLILTKTTSVK